MTNDSNDAIAASRRRIAAGISLFDRALSERPAGIFSSVNSPDALLDALGRSALETVVADLGELNSNPVESVRRNTAPTVIDREPIADTASTSTGSS